MLQKIKDALARFSYGRYGTDKLNTCLTFLGLALLILSLIIRLPLLLYLGLALYIVSMFRIFSRNTEKRRAENQKFESFFNRVKVSFNQAKNRAKNSKQYKYFRCPQCHSYLKLPRGVGEVTVTCGKCKNQFRKKA